MNSFTEAVRASIQERGIKGTLTIVAVVLEEERQALGDVSAAILKVAKNGNGHAEEKISLSIPLEPVLEERAKRMDDRSKKVTLERSRELKRELNRIARAKTYMEVGQRRRRFRDRNGIVEQYEVAADARLATLAERRR